LLMSLLIRRCGQVCDHSSQSDQSVGSAPSLRASQSLARVGVESVPPYCEPDRGQFGAVRNVHNAVATRMTAPTSANVGQNTTSTEAMSPATEWEPPTPVTEDTAGATADTGSSSARTVTSATPIPS